MASTTSCIALFVVLLCAVVPGALSINFNLTLNDECTYPTGCSFFNASIWEGGNVPTANDDVNITGSWDASMGEKALYIYIEPNNVVSLKSLTVYAAALVVLPNTTVSINGTAYLNSKGAVYINETGSFNAGFLVVVSDAWLVAHGTVSAVNATLVGGFRLHNVFQVVDLTFGSYNYSLVGFTGTNSISVLPAVTFDVPFELQVNTLNVEPNATVNLLRTVTITKIQIASNAVVEAHGPATIGTNSSNALSGSGSIYFRNTASVSSNLTANFAGTIYVGDVVLSLYGGSFSNLVFNSENTTVYVSGVTFSGSVTVKGALVVSTQLVANELILLGKLSVENASLTVLTSLQLTDNSTFVLEQSKLTLAGVVTGNLVIPATSTLITSKNTTVRGHFENHASISLSATNSLNVFGNAILHNTSKISASVSSKSAAVLTVNGGSLYVAGQLAYSIAKKPILNSNTYLVANVVNGTVNGTFNQGQPAQAVAGSQITRDLPISYTESAITINYKWGIKDTQWWLWLILAVGITVVIGVIAIVIRIRVRRAKYTPVR